MAVKRMAGLNSFERRQQLVETLRKQPGLRIHELAKLLAVSPGTVRNDLIALEHEGRLIRVHGGAAIIDNG
ncbi:MAG TPA: DeoR family transcriptional regulator, partial [Anaerolineaceae bacterium]